MQWKTPKNTDKYQWTAHVSEKMHYYGLSEQKVLGVIRNPQRIETGIVENTVAVMIPVGNTQKILKPRWGRPAPVFASAKASTKQLSSERESSSSSKAPADTWNQEIWVMYQLRGKGPFAAKNDMISAKDEEAMQKLEAQYTKFGTSEQAKKLMKLMPKKLIIISAWRYPGVSPKNNPIPEEILREIEETIHI